MQLCNYATLYLTGCMMPPERQKSLFGMSREPDVYSDLNVVSDPFHEPNHTTCSDSYKSTQNPKFREQNKEAAEQFNSILSRISTPLLFMKPENYMRALSQSSESELWVRASDHLLCLSECEVKVMIQSGGVATWSVLKWTGMGPPLIVQAHHPLPKLAKCDVFCLTVKYPFFICLP